MVDKKQKIDDIQKAVTLWVKGFDEPVGHDTLATALAGHWHEEVWLDDFHALLNEMVEDGQIKDAGHGRYTV